MFVADLIGTVKEYGVPGGVLLVSLGLLKWVDTRLRRVETTCDRNDGVLEEVRKDVRWMREHWRDR